MNQAISVRCLVNLNRVLSHFPHCFWSSYEYLIQFQTEYYFSLLNDHMSNPSPSPHKPNCVVVCQA